MSHGTYIRYMCLRLPYSCCISFPLLPPPLYSMYFWNTLLIMVTLSLAMQSTIAKYGIINQSLNQTHMSSVWPESSHQNYMTSILHSTPKNTASIVCPLSISNMEMRMQNKYEMDLMECGRQYIDWLSLNWEGGTLVDSTYCHPLASLYRLIVWANASLLSGCGAGQTPKLSATSILVDTFGWSWN